MERKDVQRIDEKGAYVGARGGFESAHVTERRTFKQLLCSLPKRAVELLIKIISKKGLALALATALLLVNMIDQWVWFAVIGLFIGASTGEKIIGRMSITS